MPLSKTITLEALIQEADRLVAAALKATPFPEGTRGEYQTGMVSIVARITAQMIWRYHGLVSGSREEPRA